jgi:hypothetical protein
MIGTLIKANEKENFDYHTRSHFSNLNRLVPYKLRDDK